jgi:restriction system protein
MAEITNKRVGELQRGVLRILLDQPEGLAAKEVLQRMEQVVPPTDFEKTDYPNNPGVRRFEKMVRFATIAPVKAGWLVKDKGKWYLTEDGKKAYSNYSDPEKFRREATRLFYQWKDKQPKEIPEADLEEASSVVNGIANPSSTFDEADETAWSEIEQYVQVMNPFDLQRLVAANYFERWGFMSPGYRLRGQIKESILLRTTISLESVHRA